MSNEPSNPEHFYKAMSLLFGPPEPAKKPDPKVEAKKAADEFAEAMGVMRKALLAQGFTHAEAANLINSALLYNAQGSSA